jgi:glycosyltransferase involved in cell wall biosynthesis
MTKPYFSIVIPTRNRPQLILDTVISAVSQNYESFEVIVSDNSSDEKTWDALKVGQQLDNINYVRPPQELSMPDHWEFASTQARGKYVLILTDRAVLKQGALAIVCRALATPEFGDVHVCAWRWSIFDDELGIITHGTEGSESMFGCVLNSVDVATRFVKPQKNYPYTLPRALNSCYSAEIAAKIRAQHGKLFSPINPDFASAFLILAYVDKLIYIDAPLFISRGLDVSNGGNAQKTDASIYLKSLGMTNSYRHVPIKAAVVENIIYEDFLMAKDMAGGNLLKVEIDWAEYFIRCNKEIQFKRTTNILNQRQIDVLQAEWNRALKSMDRKIQHKVTKTFQVSRTFKIRSVLRRMLFINTIRRVINFIRSPKQRYVTQTLDRCTPTNILEAAGHYPSYKV